MRTYLKKADLSARRGGEKKMRLTKTQKTIIYDKLPGCGELVLSLGGSRMMQADFHYGKNGKWYRGDTEINDWLTDIVSEIMEEKP